MGAKSIGEAMASIEQALGDIRRLTEHNPGSASMDDEVGEYETTPKMVGRGRKRRQSVALTKKQTESDDESEDA
jgi:hypothetical protein